MNCKGLTLIELAAAISIAAIVGLVVVPAISGIAERQRASTATYGVLHSLAQAREYAVNNNIHVSICPSPNGSDCGKDWGSHLIVYVDRHGDGKLEDGADILHAIPLDGDWRVKWAAFGNKPHLTVTGQGYTKHQNGSFYLCPDDNRLGRIVVVNKAGRGRMAPDANRNGFAEKTNGKDMSC